MSFGAALDRQIEFQKRTGFQAKYVVSYDRIVDEVITKDGVRKKVRVDGRRARRYVDETIDAAQYLTEHRDEVAPSRLILSCQGVSPPQYARCMKEVLYLSDRADVIGFGGQCIIGQRPGLTKDFFRVLEDALPKIRSKGIRRIHIFGVGTFPVLVRVQALCWKAGVVPSYDTSALEVNATWGKFAVPPQPGDWLPSLHVSRVFGRKDKFKLFHPRDVAMANIELAIQFWEKIDKMYPLRTDV